MSVEIAPKKPPMKMVEVSLSTILICREDLRLYIQKTMRQEMEIFALLMELNVLQARHGLEVLLFNQKRVQKDPNKRR